MKVKYINSAEEECSINIDAMNTRGLIFIEIDHSETSSQSIFINEGQAKEIIKFLSDQLTK